MEQPNHRSMGTDSAYRLFLARVMGGWIFLLFLFLWVTKTLPHHFPEMPPDTKIDPEVAAAYSLLWIIVSTLLLFFLIVPGRFAALLLMVLMGMFIQCYKYGGLSLLNPAFVWVLIPFLLPVRWFKRSWQTVKWILLISLALHSWLLPISLKAIPGYTLYLIPIMPWERWFVSFNERFEPK